MDQQTGFVTIDSNSYSTNLVSDLTPELGGDLDVLTRNIYSSLGNVAINDTLDVNGLIREIFSSVYYPIATQVDIGTDSNQIPLNQNLGQLAFLDEVARLRSAATAPTNNLDINFEYVSDTSIKIRMRGSDGTVRSTTLTLA